MGMCWGLGTRIADYYRKKEITCIMTIPKSPTLSRKKLHPWRSIDVY